MWFLHQGMASWSLCLPSPHSFPLPSHSCHWHCWCWPMAPAEVQFDFPGPCVSPTPPSLSWGQVTPIHWASQHRFLPLLWKRMFRTSRCNPCTMPGGQNFTRLPARPAGKLPRELLVCCLGVHPSTMPTAVYFWIHISSGGGKMTMISSNFPFSFEGFSICSMHTILSLVFDHQIPTSLVHKKIF